MITRCLGFWPIASKSICSTTVLTSPSLSKVIKRLMVTPFSGTDEELPDQLLTVIKDKWGSTVEEVERGTDKYTINTIFP